ncbi:hypothetical protein ACH49M_21415 [Rhodococcus qingshengii]|uniref:hypothetical protein n=1 Tax=Rhodococcus qingshengii TaxID=334542 RepID=UPI0036F89D83
MSSNGEDIIRETFEKLGDAIGVQMQMPDAMITNLGAVLQAQIGLLAELQSTGRLIPAGGMALTAEQVEGLKFALGQLERGGPAFEAAHERLRALFPATEPAEDSVGDPLQAWKDFLKPKPIGWYRTMELDFAAKHFGFPSNPVFEDRYTAPDGGKWQWTDELQWELRCYPPAPVEPAEEETKAEVFDLNALVRQLAQAGWRERERGEWFAHEPSIEWDTQLDWQQQIEYQVVRGILTELKRLGLFSVPASSPVVSAPTETGPWATWESVPDDVWFTSASAVGFLPAHRKRGSLVDWQFRDGSVGVYDVSRIGNGKLMALAPFVAAEEG